MTLQDPASLENLRDIVVPPAAPWWPLAPGWWVLGTLLLVTAAVVAYQAWRRWRANAYRRLALSELEAATDVVGIAEILKRAALSAYPRTQVASLSSEAWTAYLAETASRPVPEVVQQALCRDQFADRATDAFDAVTAFARMWINEHRTTRDVRLGQNRETHDRRAAQQAQATRT